ncbi:MAG: cytidyltransferase [Verrucomicrobia bacterium]|jgi:CMP-N-acetylneuraminic acid synthetase|nr:cytidyltransferase [Verrucomicrobiota bacterium]
MKCIAMIPARMGSQRLKQKNLRLCGGIPLIVRAIRKCKEAGLFDSIWVNSEHKDFGTIADDEGVHFHQRPKVLGNNQATSEQYIAEFLEVHECDLLFQVHSIAPLLTVTDLQQFVTAMTTSRLDCLLSYEPIQIECALNGKPVNFDLSEKTNSQELPPVQRITWSITGWRRSSYLAAARTGQCATYSGQVGFHPVSRFAAHVIKTEEDLQIAEALLPVVGATPS